MTHLLVGGCVVPERRAQVWALLAKGMSNTAIAQEMGITVTTVERHTSAIYDQAVIRSMGQSRRVAAARLYLGLA